MTRFSFAFLLLLTLGASTTLATSNHAVRRQAHDKIARSNNVTERGTQQDWKLHKRFDQARFTYYKAGLGACGGTNGDGDSIVALNAPQFDSGQHCNEQISITYNGKTVSASIVDRCVECPYGALDLTEGLFTQLASTDAGTIYGSWTFGNGEPSSSSSPPPAPTTESSTSTWSPPPTTSSSSSSSTSTSSSSFTISSSSTSTSATSTSTTSSAAPTASSGLIEIIELGVGGIGGLIATAQATLQ